MVINKILGFVWSLIAVVLLCILIFGLRGKGLKVFRYKGGNLIETGNPYSTDIFDADNINSLSIDLLSESLTVKSHNEDCLKVELYCTEDTAPAINVENSVLSVISKRAKINIHGIINNRKVVIYVPNKKQFENVDINLVSGSMHIYDLKAENYKSNSVSGSSNFDECKFDTMNITQTSGSLHLINTDSKNIEADCTSGSIHIDGTYEEMDLKSSSGSVNVNLEKPLVKNSSIVSTSGSLHLNIPSKSNLKIEYKTNGSYKNSITGTSGKNGTETMGNGSVNLFMKATSGSIHID